MEERAERWRGWMVEAQRGDGQAYQRLLEELLPFVRGLVRARMGDQPSVEDIVQEVLLSVHTARHTYRPERPLTPWVRAIARNAVVDWARRQARAREVSLEHAEPWAQAPPAPERRISRGLLRALATLPAPQREAVVLLKVEGLTVQEAAERAGTTPGALKLRAHRGYRALRDVLGRKPS